MFSILIPYLYFCVPFKITIMSKIPTKHLKFIIVHRFICYIRCENNHTVRTIGTKGNQNKNTALFSYHETPTTCKLLLSHNEGFNETTERGN